MNMNNLMGDKCLAFIKNELNSSININIPQLKKFKKNVPRQSQTNEKSQEIFNHNKDTVSILCVYLIVLTAVDKLFSLMHHRTVSQS